MESEPDTSSVTACVCIVTPMQIECIPICQALSLQRDGDVWHGQMGPLAIVAAVCGIGQTVATSRIEQLINQYKPTRLLLTGFAGGLSEEVDIGWVLTADIIANEAGERLKLTDRPPEPISETPAGSRTILTSDQLIDSPQRKQALHQKHGAVAVDMESFAIARLAEERCIPLTMTRAISDRASEALPAWTQTCVNPDGSSRVASTAAKAIIMPWRIPTLLRLQRNSKVAGEALAYWVEGKLSQWAATLDKTLDDE